MYTNVANLVEIRSETEKMDRTNIDEHSSLCNQSKSSFIASSDECWLWPQVNEYKNCKYEKRNTFNVKCHKDRSHYLIAKILYRYRYLSPFIKQSENASATEQSRSVKEMSLFGRLQLRALEIPEMNSTPAPALVIQNRTSLRALKQKLGI